MVTSDGREVRGARINEDTFTIQLRDSNGQFQSFRKAEVKQIEKDFGKSLMPSYKDRLTASEVGGPGRVSFEPRRCPMKLATAFLSVALLSATVFAQVPYRRIAAADADPSNWLTYSGNYQAQRYSGLTQINRQNIAQLKPAWVYQMRNPGIAETTPIVADGVMYITEPPSTVTALDVRTGRPLWTYTPNIPQDVIIIGSPPVNRGVAVLDDLVYLATVHTHLIAFGSPVGRRTLGYRCRGQQAGLLHDACADGHRRKDHHRNIGRGNRYSRFYRCVRCENG